LVVGTLKKKNFHTSLLRVLGQRLIFGWYEAKYNTCYQDWHKTGARLVFIPQVLATKLV
jgi:hypothetical protein